MASAVHKSTRVVAAGEAPRNGVLTGSDLLSRLPTEDVETPIGIVRIHGLGALDLIDLQATARDIGDDDAKNARFMLDLVARGLDAPVEEVGRQSFAVLKPLYEAVMRLSGLTPEAVEEAMADLKAAPSDEN